MARGPFPMPIYRIEVQRGDIRQGKQCTRCGIVKTLDSFHKTPSHSSKRSTQCGRCINEKRRDNYREYNRTRRRKTGA